MSIRIRFSFTELRRTLFFLVALVSALWGPINAVWNNVTIWKDDPASWYTIFLTHIVPIGGVLALFWEKVKQQDMIPHWILNMDADQAAVVVRAAQDTGTNGPSLASVVQPSQNTELYGVGVPQANPTQPQSVKENP